MKIGEIEKIGTREPLVIVPPFEPSRRDAPTQAPAPPPAEPAKRERVEEKEPA